MEGQMNEWPEWGLSKQRFYNIIKEVSEEIICWVSWNVQQEDEVMAVPNNICGYLWSNIVRNNATINFQVIQQLLQVHHKNNKEVLADVMNSGREGN